MQSVNAEMADATNPGNAEPQLGTNTHAELGLGVPRWHSRGYLPHFDARDTLQSVTFRLADSLPQSVLRELEHDLKAPEPRLANVERRRKIEVDSGLGCCALGLPKLPALMQETL